MEQTSVEQRPVDGRAYQHWSISEDVIERGRQAERVLEPVFRRLEALREENQLRVLKAMQAARVSESGFGGTTGYGYDDLGREQLEAAFAEVMGAERALVRWSITTGTQAIAACLYGSLRPGDELLSVTGAPYDTLTAVIGTGTETGGAGPGGGLGVGSLRDFGVRFRSVDMAADGLPDWDAVAQAVRPETRMVLIQRSRGYSARQALRMAHIERLIQSVRAQKPDVLVLVDNCYGEWTDTREPCAAGADLCAGSLIKNPGGGIAPGGGYIAGTAAAVERAAAHLTAPGLGRHVGATFGVTRLLMQGLFLSPHVVCESLKGMALAAYLFEQAGLKTSPAFDAVRGDIIQVLEFGCAEDMIRFCQGVQQSAPVDAFVSPVPAPMPGYDCDVIMAAGAFVQGSSLELSADGPLKPPYRAFMQGGLVYEQVKLAALLFLQKTADLGGTPGGPAPCA